MLIAWSSPSRIKMRAQEPTTRPAHPARRLLQRLGMLACLAMAVFAMPVTAATTINPIVIEVPADGRAIVTIRNDGAREVLYQVTVLRWQVVDGVDHYDATEDFIASPPLFTLGPSASQVVRIGFRNLVLRPVEQTYRLLLAEVPTEVSSTLQRPGDTSAEAGVVEISLQYLLPVFVAPADQGARSVLVWSMRADGDAVVVRAKNLGNRRAVLNMVGLSSQSGADPAPEYASNQRLAVLAGSWREWRIAVPADKISSPWRILYITSESAAPKVVSNAEIRPSNSP
jgi:fimbrial chaperone protein